MKWIAAFGAFWYDFIVGDSIVLAIGGVGSLILGYLVAQTGLELAEQLIVPAAVIATLVASLPWLWARR